MTKCLSIAEIVEKADIKIKKRKSGDSDVKTTLDYSEDVVDNAKLGPRPIVSAPRGCVNTTAKRARLSS